MGDVRRSGATQSPAPRAVVGLSQLRSVWTLIPIALANSVCVSPTKVRSAAFERDAVLLLVEQVLRRVPLEGGIDRRTTALREVRRSERIRSLCRCIRRQMHDHEVRSRAPFGDLGEGVARRERDDLDAGGQCEVPLADNW